MIPDPFAAKVTDDLPRRPILRSLARGFRCRCPNCGSGKLFHGYLKSVPSCAACGEDFTHQRADDAPPYITMVVVGHVLVPTILAMQLATDWPNAVYLAIWLPLTAALALSLLRPVKGTVIALQWALRMHGFDGGAAPDSLDVLGVARIAPLPGNHETAA